MKKRTLVVTHILFLIVVGFLPAGVEAQLASLPAQQTPAGRPGVTSGSTGSHDPSRMMLCEGKYYVYSTGGGMKFSADGVNWTAGPSPFGSPAPATGPAVGGRVGRGKVPASVAALVPSNQGIWAPDVIFYNKQYYLYYSVAATGASSPNGRGVIGLLTSPTLNPTSAHYKWTDAGVVISTENKVEKRCAIDPAPFVDANGDLWLSWGSGYANGNGPNDPTILISKLDNATGLRSKVDTTEYPVAAGHIEASYVHYHDGQYYAFWNDGGCCNGIRSTYRIHVARSKAVTGPYVNKAGNEGASEIFMATVKAEELYGPGHMGIESEPGVDRFTFHYYNAAGRPVLGVRTLVWGTDGWPTVGEDLNPGTYKITAANGEVLGVREGDSGEGAVIELQPSTGGNFQKWVVAITPEGYYQLTSAGSGEYVAVGAPAVAKNAAAVIHQAAAGAGNDQKWIIELLSDGKTYCVRSCATHEVLATAAGAGEKSTAATTAAWSNISGQKWTFIAP